MSAEEIDRVLDDNLDIIREFQRLVMERNTVTFIPDLALAADDGVHDAGCPQTRRIVQRAMYRAGHTKQIVFSTGPVMVVATIGLDDEAEGRGEIIYMPADMEAKMWTRIATRAPDEPRT